MTQAYLYKWTQLSTEKWYIGSRSRKNCHINDGYICSSRVVKKAILENRTDWKRQILCIGDPLYIRQLEGKLLTALDAKNDVTSFNCHNGDGNFTTIGREPWNKGKKTPIEVKQKLSKSRKGMPGTPHTEENKKLFSEQKKGENNPMYGKALWNKGLIGVYKQSEESNRKRSETLRGKPRPVEVIEKMKATKLAKKIAKAQSNGDCNG